VSASVAIEWREFRKAILRYGTVFDVPVPGDLQQSALLSWLERTLDNADGLYDLERTSGSGWSMQKPLPIFGQPSLSHPLILLRSALSNERIGLAWGRF
jgi:hypothetical protein